MNYSQFSDPKESDWYNSYEETGPHHATINETSVRHMISNCDDPLTKHSSGLTKPLLIEKIAYELGVATVSLMSLMKVDKATLEILTKHARSH